jgi:F-type H+-transporting ATPase subunit alpha
MLKPISPEEISGLLKKKFEEFKPAVETHEVGIVLESGDGIARIGGLPKTMAGELLEFSDNVYGIAFNLEREEIVAIILAGHTRVREGNWVRRTGYVMSVPVGEEFLGRVVDSLGKPIDRGPVIKPKKYRPIECPAPAVVDRMPVNQPLQTGYKIIDALIPIGRGQRELIIGDRSTGKSTLLTTTIVNQRKENVYCIYVCVGQKASYVVQIYNTLKKFGALDYTIIVSANAADPAALQFLAPFAGCAMAEEFMYRGKDVLIIYDDLTKHAAAYRMISLLLRRPPGREAYPGDIFYLHSRLLERAAKLAPELGGGSMTALPVVETQLGDISAYIPTNIISITDGQIFLDTGLFNAGMKPAINIAISVSRVGSNAQVESMKKVAGNLKLDLAQYREKESFSILSSELDQETQRQIHRGKIIQELIKQEKYQPMPVEEQVAVIFAGTNGFFDDVPFGAIKETEAGLLQFLRTEKAELLGKLKTEKFTAEIEKELAEAVAKFTSGSKNE